MKKILYTLLLFTCISISYHAFTNSGAGPAGYTGAPGDFGTCGNSGCHSSAPITSGTNWNNFTITTNVPASGYTPGVAYTITVSHSVAGINKWGFQAVALNSSNAQAGSITAGTGQTTGTLGGKTYVTHNSSGNTGTGSRSWSFTWTAPNPGVGDVTIYGVVNAADGNSSANSGDQIYTKSIVIGQFTNFPTAVIDGLPANGYVCLGDTLNLAGSGINSPIDFVWTFTGLPASNAQNPSVVFTTTGAKTITLFTTNTFGSSATNIKTVNVVNKPTASLVPAGATLQKCGNDSVTLSTTANSAFSFLWSPGNQTTSSIKVIDTGSYAARVSNPLTGCFVQTAPIKVLQAPTPVPVLTTSADTICNKDSLTLTSSTPFNNYRFVEGKTLLQSSSIPNYKNRFTPGVKQFGLVVTGTNGCTSDTIRKQVMVLGPLPAPVLSCGPKTTSSLTFNWTPVANAAGYEVSTDTGNTWLTFPAETLSFTIAGLNPNVNRQLWVRGRSIGLCNEGDIGTLICTNGACSPIVYTVNFDNKHCLQSASDSVSVPITVSNLNLVKFGISIDNKPYSTNLSQSYNVKVGGNPVKLMIVDSNNVGCPRVDSTIVLFGLNPVVKPPVLITPETLCKGDSAVHHIAVLNANAGASYFDLFKSASGTAIARLNANGDSVLVYSAPAPTSPIQNGDVLYTIATDTVTGCSKQSDTLLATVVDAPNAGFTYERTGLNITFTDTTFASVSRSWFFNGAAPDSLNTPVTYVQTFPQGGTYEVVLKSANSQGCFDYTTQSVVVFNTGWDEVSEIPLSVYPNPANDRLFVNCESAVSGLIRVTDVHGKKVTMDLEMKDGKGMIDIQSLAPGYYQISIFTNEFVKVVRFIKE